MDEIEKLKEKEKYLWLGEKIKYIEQLESALDKACELLANGREVFCKDYFIHGHIENKPANGEFLEEFSVPELMELLKQIDPDKYIEFGFDDVKEA